MQLLLVGANYGLMYSSVKEQLQLLGSETASCQE